MENPAQAENRRPTALFVGAFVPGTQGTRGISEDVALRLSQAGWTILTTSHSPSKIGRLTDIMATCWLERNRCDIAAIDVYSGIAFRWAEAACSVLRKAGKRYVLMLHGGNLPTFAKQHRRRVKSFLGSATAVTAPSRYLQENMQAYRSDILLVPNALDIASYPYRERNTASPRIIWLRAFHETYNPVLAVQVLARLAPVFPKIELTMVGPDKGDGSLGRTRREAERLGVSSRSRIICGVPKSQVPLTLTLADIFINTTRTDNTPVSVLEAMACGLCVVSTNVGGIPYLLEDERNALLVASEDGEAMASAVSRILSNSELAAHLSQQARQDTLAFDWPSITRKWDTLLRTAAHLSTGSSTVERKMGTAPSMSAELSQEALSSKIAAPRRGTPA